MPCLQTPRVLIATHYCQGTMDDPFVTCLPKPSHRKTIESNREESDFFKNVLLRFQKDVPSFNRIQGISTISIYFFSSPPRFRFSLSLFSFSSSSRRKKVNQWKERSRVNWFSKLRKGESQGGPFRLRDARAPLVVATVVQQLARKCLRIVSIEGRRADSIRFPDSSPLVSANRCGLISPFPF